VIKKRLAGAITVKGGLAVQSFGYNRHLPMGKPEIVAENLDRWGADEIIVKCIDRAKHGNGPDLAILERIARTGLATPVVYSGGIRTVEHGIAAMKAGADRICLDAVLHDTPAVAATLSDKLGAQAIIASLPLSVEDGVLRWLDHRTRTLKALSNQLLDVLASGVVSEVQIIDWKNEGRAGGFDPALLEKLPLRDIPLILFGGLSEPDRLSEMFQHPQVAAVAIGNFLSYREHSILHYKSRIANAPLRPAPQTLAS